MIVDPDMPDHWKTRMLADLLNDELAPVYLLRLWGHCQNRKKSVFDRLPPVAVKAICRYQGSADDLESALSECGFISRHTDGQIEVVGWAEHNANLWSAWENGKKGGRPPKPKENPPDNPQKPTDNPPGTGRSPDEGDEGDEGEERGNSTPPPPKKKTDPTPYQEITEAYNRLCPSLKTCRALNDKRKRRMRKLWQSLMPTLEHWEAYFADCEATDAYAGRFPPRPPYDEPFKADLDFLLRDETVTKVLER